MKKVLVVHDDKGICEMLTMILEYCGYEVECLCSADKVFEKLSSYKADVLLMDIMIAGLDGREICHEIKINTQTSKLPVLLMSATHFPSLSTSSEDAPDGFFEKPFDMDLLLKEIDRLAA